MEVSVLIEVVNKLRGIADDISQYPLEPGLSLKVKRVKAEIDELTKECVTVNRRTIAYGIVEDEFFITMRKRTNGDLVVSDEKIRLPVFRTFEDAKYSILHNGVPNRSIHKCHIVVSPNQKTRK